MQAKSQFNVRAALVAALIFFVGASSFWVGFTHFLHEFGRHNIDAPQNYPDLNMGRVILIATVLGVIVALAAGIFFGLVWVTQPENGECARDISALYHF